MYFALLLLSVFLIFQEILKEGNMNKYEYFYLTTCDADPFYQIDTELHFITEELFLGK